MPAYNQYPPPFANQAPMPSMSQGQPQAGYQFPNAQQMNPPTGQPQATQYGYAQAPGQGGMGYYEQQTPVGSFAAANFNGAGPAQSASNPYLGQSSQMAGGSAGQATAGSNPYFGFSNPYTAQAVDAASQAATRNYNLAIAPQRDAQMARSGSFGNTGVQQMQMEDQRNLQGTLGNIATNAYMQDLAAQQQMGEAAANRGTSNSQFNVGARAGDLNRNMQGTQFDAGLAQQLGMFNAGQGNQMGQFNASQGNQMNMFNAAAGNSMLGQQRQLGQNQNQFDQNFDFQTWLANNNQQRLGTQDQLNFMDRLMNWQQQGVGAATNVQNTPLNYWQMFNGGAAQLGGMGGTNSQVNQGNPWLGAIGGAQVGGTLYNNWGN